MDSFHLPQQHQVEDETIQVASYDDLESLNLSFSDLTNDNFEFIDDLPTSPGVLSSLERSSQRDTIRLRRLKPQVLLDESVDDESVLVEEEDRSSSSARTS